MGYNPRPSMVTKYSHILNDIKSCIDAGKELGIPLPIEDLTRESEKLHAILRSAKLFTHLENGRYSDLRDRATVTVDWERSRIMIVPKGVKNPHYQTQVPDERDALASLGSTSSPTNLEFKPSSNFNPDRFERQVNALGWTIARAEEDDPGSPEEGWPAQQAGEWVVAAGTPEGWIGLIATRNKRVSKAPNAFDQILGRSSDS